MATATGAIQDQLTAMRKGNIRELQHGGPSPGGHVITIPAPESPPENTSEGIQGGELSAGDRALHLRHGVWHPVTIAHVGYNSVWAQRSFTIEGDDGFIKEGEHPGRLKPDRIPAKSAMKRR